MLVEEHAGKMETEFPMSTKDVELSVTIADCGNKMCIETGEELNESAVWGEKRAII